MYVELKQLDGLIPHNLIVEALDDNKDGEIDEAAWNAVVAAVDASIDGPLSARYAVPLALPFPPVVRDGSIILTCEALYLRRGVIPEQNPFLSRANAIRARLDKIGSGEIALTPTSVKGSPSGAVICEPTRLGPVDRLLG